VTLSKDAERDVVQYYHYSADVETNTKSPSFVYLSWLLVILLDPLKCTPASIPRRRRDLPLNATWYKTRGLTKGHYTSVSVL